MSARNATPWAVGLGLALAGVAQAQAPTPAMEPPAPPAAAPAPLAPSRKVAADTVVDIEIAEPISTKVQKRGDMFAIRLARPIMLDGAVLVPGGVAGQGQVVDAASAGFLGKPAKLVLAARYLTWNGQRLPLHGFRWLETGEDRTDAVLVTSFVPYAGVLSIFIHGGEIEVPVGAHALAKLGADIPAPPPAAAPPQIPAPAQ